MELLSRLFDITKLPSKFFAWVVALTAGYLFLPPSVQAGLHLDSFPKEYKAYAGVAFIAAASFLAINFSLWVWARARHWSNARSAQARVVEAIAQLDYSEKSVLREFFIQGRHVIELPFDHPTVTGLCRKGILLLSGTQGYRSLAGSVFPVALTGTARALLEPEHVDLPRNPSEQEVSAIQDARPNFLSEIERHDQWRGGI